MATTPKRLIPGSQLTAAAATYYTATNVKARIDAMTLCNSTTGAVTVTVHLVPLGGTADNTNIILKAQSLNAGASYRVVEALGHWLMAGDTIQAFASAATSIDIVASGVEFA